MPGTLRRLTLGAVAGAAATGAMSVVMLGSRRIGAVRSSVEPKVITEAGLDAGEVEVSDRTVDVLSAVAHLGFGSAMGAAFGLIQPRMPVPSLVSGAAYGLAIAAASYQGWVPAAGIMPSLQDQDPPRRSQLLLAHLVYGAVLAGLTPSTKGEGRR